MSETLLEKISNAAKERFQNIAFPTRKDEYWRFADLDTWSVDTLFPYFTGRPPEEGCNSEFEDLEHEESQGGCVLLFDGQLLDGEAPKGVEIYSSGAAADEFPEIVEKFHSKASGKFDTLVSTRPDFGILIRVLDGESATLDLKIISKLTVSAASVIVWLGKGSSLRLRKTNLAFGGSFAALKCGYVLEENSSLELASLKYSSKYSIAYEREDFSLAEGSSVVDAVALSAKGPSRQERNFEISSSGCSADSRIFVSADSDATQDIRTSQIHSKPMSDSNMEIRATLDGLAKLAFTGLISVDKNAVKTRSYQSCRSLMLSDTAKCQASPVLEISCSDVECSHGCAVSKPSDEQMFYMMQRGIGEEAAKGLIVRSFAETSFEKISDRDLVGKWLGRLF